MVLSGGGRPHRRGEPITLAFDVTMRYGDELPPSNGLYLSAMVPGGPCSSLGEHDDDARPTRGPRAVGLTGGKEGRSAMTTRFPYFERLRALLEAMPPAMIDMDQIEAHELRSGHRFADPPEYFDRWLLDEQRRVQGI